MTFGQALKQILNISGMKLAQLSDALGYDSSYISRWVNDIKIPSLKNNDDLFEKIAQTALKSCDRNCMEHLKAVYTPDGQSDLLAALIASLRDAYESSSPVFKANLQSLNAVYLCSDQMINESVLYADAIIRAALEKKSAEVNCIVGTPLSLHSNKANGFWDRVMAHPGICGQIRVTIHQIVNMWDFSNCIDSYCAAICTFSNYHQDIHYEFYKDESVSMLDSRQYFAVEDQLLCHVLSTSFSDASSTIICTDRETLAKQNSRMKWGLSRLNKLITYCSSPDELSGHFLYDYIMDGHLRYFLSIMHPVYISEALSDNIRAQYVPEMEESDFQVLYNRLCSNSEKEVILYRSAFLEYVYSGSLFIFGEHITLSKEERLLHLQELLENIRQGRCRMAFLNDNNPLLRREEMTLSFYLSRKTGFATSHIRGALDATFRFTSHRGVEYFNLFFEHILQLGDEYVIKDREAEAFVRRALDLLQ